MQPPPPPASPCAPSCPPVFLHVHPCPPLSPRVSSCPTSDYYLLRSRQPELLEALSGSQGLHIPPRALPNMLLSSALALFQLEYAREGASATASTSAGAGAGSGAGAAGVGSGGPGGSPATLRLVCALLLFPGVLAPMLDKAGV